MYVTSEEEAEAAKRRGEKVAEWLHHEMRLGAFSEKEAKHAFYIEGVSKFLDRIFRDKDDAKDVPSEVWEYILACDYSCSENAYKARWYSSLNLGLHRRWRQLQKTEI
jgi:DNA-binding MltR family transcriptional regulator